MSKANVLPVVAAIPNYNMADSLGRLLSELAAQDYADIYVLDDASTDHSRDVVADFPDVKFVGGRENRGAGATRNRIIPALGGEAIIHFIDADMNEVTPNAPEVARDVLLERTGFVGGLIRTASGMQHCFNYGPRHGIRGDLSSLLQIYVDSAAQKDAARGQALRERFADVLQAYPDTASTPQPRHVFWSAEANLLIRSEVFERMGGFDPRLREHEIHDLAIRLDGAGLEQRFDPTLEATHTAVQVRESRQWQLARAQALLVRRHGLFRWLSN